MTGGAFTESMVEKTMLAWLEAIGWRVAHGPDTAPDMPAAEHYDQRLWVFAGQPSRGRL